MMRINLKQYRVFILLLISCIAVVMPYETLARRVNNNTITLYSLLPTKRNSNLNSFSWKSNVGNVGRVYIRPSGKVWLSLNSASLKNQLTRNSGDWSTISLNTVTFSELEYAWGKASAPKASAKEDYSTFKLKGFPSKGKPGIYFVDVIFIDNKLDEYRIRRDGIFDSSWIKAKKINGCPIHIQDPEIIIDNRILYFPKNFIELPQRKIDKLKDSRKSVNELWKTALMHNSDIQIIVRRKSRHPKLVVDSELIKILDDTLNKIIENCNSYLSDQGKLQLAKSNINDLILMSQSPKLDKNEKTKLEYVIKKEKLDIQRLNQKVASSLKKLDVILGAKKV